MDPKTSYKLPIHYHPLFFSTRLSGKCGACHFRLGAIFDEGYTCKVCNVRFHKECAKAPQEIKHPSHPEHPLNLTVYEAEYRLYVSSYSKLCPCSLCGNVLTFTPWYRCYKCDFDMDFTCSLKPSPLAIKNPLCHDHPLFFLKKQSFNEVSSTLCGVCKDFIFRPCYTCVECDVYFHFDCIHLSKEVNHPHHSNHPLKLVASETLKDERRCGTLDPQETISFSLACSVCCGTISKPTIYHCSLCDFIACLDCARSPPPITIEHFKTHKHPLTIFSRKITFTCDVCALEETTVRPYFCLQCDFITHEKCINLPRVININRHPHRIYFTHRLIGLGYSKCGICRKNLSQYRGAYSCSTCPNYAVHSQCATGKYIWDGVELEGVPDDTEDISPFKVVGDNLISHFSHEEHPLKFFKDDHIFIEDKWIRCEACMHLLGFGSSSYGCKKCCFFLHEKCANLPKKKRLIFGTEPYTLEVRSQKVVECEQCGMLYGGFKYTSKGRKDVDVHCGSLSDPLVHDSHIHPLYFEAKSSKFYCGGCKNDVTKDFALHCDECKFDLCFNCANLPLKTWHMRHEHPLTLCYGKVASNVIWCDICERELDPSKWFYACSDCGVTMHVPCVIEDFSYLKLKGIFLFRGEGFHAARNNHSTRPTCYFCKRRCTTVNIIHTGNMSYFCSYWCLLDYMF